MYIKQNIEIGTFFSQLLAGTALPTGGASPFRINEEVKAALSEAGSVGLEGTISTISPSVSGGHWQGDSGKGYIGNLQCRVKFGENETFANLAVCDVIAAFQNGGKTTFHMEVTKSKDGTREYTNIRAVKPIVFDANDQTIIAAIESIKALAAKTQVAELKAAA